MSNDRPRAEGTVNLSVSAFPVKLWDEWEKDCKEKFGDCRWIKMWNDHLLAKDKEVLEVLIKEVNELKDRIDGIESKKKGDSNVVKTLTSEIRK